MTPMEEITLISISKGMVACASLVIGGGLIAGWGGALVGLGVWCLATAP